MTLLALLYLGGLWGVLGRPSFLTGVATTLVIVLLLMVLQVLAIGRTLRIEANEEFSRYRLDAAIRAQLARLRERRAKDIQRVRDGGDLWEYVRGVRVVGKGGVNCSGKDNHPHR
ncbi:MAG: hypothetical protein JXA37_11365 [Chloroflexia bacterium]|nr:hypothetical protein [Chloroflexia bacterium]